LGGLRATYDDYLRLTGKCIVDFLLVLIELFSLGVRLRDNVRCSSWAHWKEHSGLRISVNLNFLH